MRGLGLETHGSVVGATRVLLGIIGARAVPRQTDQYRRKRAICASDSSGHCTRSEQGMATVDAIEYG